MAVMRVEKTTNYTVMSNYHLRDKRLTLKAKGLLSLMLSLPEEWDFTLNGLTMISKEGVSAIRAAISELEENGYVVRTRVRNDAGQMIDMEYTIYEFPQNNTESDEGILHDSNTSSDLVPDPEAVALANDSSVQENPTCEKPMLEKPMLENPILENPILEKPMLENRTQLNTKEKKKDIKNTDTSNPDQSNIHPSIPVSVKPMSMVIQNNSVKQTIPVSTESFRDDMILSPSQTRAETMTEQQMFMSEPSAIPEMRRKLSFSELERKIKKQIDYLDLIDGNNKDEIDNILTIMVEVMSTKCECFTISGKKYPADLVHRRYSQINYHTLLYVLECLHKNGSDIRNIKQYLIATLFNAPATCKSYYAAAVRRDFEYLRQ